MEDAGRTRGWAIAASIGAVLWTVALAAAPQPRSDAGPILERVGARLAEYYRRAQHVICTELSTVQPIESNWTPEGLARTVESELRVELPAMDGDELADAKVVRDILRINGRAPRPRDAKDRSACTDPTVLSPEPLAFLLPSRRAEYRFGDAGVTRERGRAAFAIDFSSAARGGRPELIEDPGGHDDCFDWSGPVETRGRVWIDVETHDVLRVDRHLPGPVDLRVPQQLQRRYSFGPYVVLDRDDMTLRYAPVRFSDPDEVLLLPESMDAITVLRSSLQSVRRTQTFRDYRRFLTAGRVVKRP